MPPKRAPAQEETPLFSQARDYRSMRKKGKSFVFQPAHEWVLTGSTREGERGNQELAMPEGLVPLGAESVQKPNCHWEWRLEYEDLDSPGTFAPLFLL